MVGNKRSMVIIDLGTKVISVNQSLLRKDYDLLGDIEIPLPAEDADKQVSFYYRPPKWLRSEKNCLPQPVFFFFWLGGHLSDHPASFTPSALEKALLRLC